MSKRPELFSRRSTVTIAGNPLNFTGTNPTATVAGAGNMTVSAPVNLGANLTVAGAGTGGLTLGGAIAGGTNNIIKTSAGALTLSGGGTLNQLSVGAGNAFITGGTFRSNRLELTVEYINDRFFLTGEWRDGMLSGTWRAHDDMDRGQWVATRPQPAPRMPDGKVVALCEWKNAAGQRRYSIDEKMPGWTRETKPLCRVWVAQ